VMFTHSMRVGDVNWGVKGSSLLSFTDTISVTTMLGLSAIAFPYPPLSFKSFETYIIFLNLRQIIKGDLE